MRVHIVADSAAKLSAIGRLLADKVPATSGLLGKARLRAGIHAVVVAADLRDIDNISALKQLAKDFGRIPKRVFLIDQTSRLAIVQAYALGATRVLSNPVSGARLLGQLVEPGVTASESPHPEPAAGAQQAVAAGAACFAAMFAAILSGSSLDIEATKRIGSDITNSIAEHGLTDWLAAVRDHHEGTFQHCLLVTGIAVDFGLSLGVARNDIERLYSAAMFHDIGKARIPLAVLDKPGRLDPEERLLIEQHPVIGYDVLEQSQGVSPEILDAVRHHHEFLDGSGYPDKLGASSIADLVRVLTISDIFAALIESRSYKPTMPRAQAYDILRDMSMNGKLETPLVKAFREVALTR